MTRIDLPAETLLVEVSKKDGVKILETQGQMHTIDDNATAQCDVCSAPLGAYKDVKHMLSPELFSKAVKRGYRPLEMLEKSETMLKSMGETDPVIIRGIMKQLIDSWVDMVEIGETPWALCEKCYGEMQKFEEK